MFKAIEKICKTNNSYKTFIVKDKYKYIAIKL